MARLLPSPHRLEDCHGAVVTWAPQHPDPWADPQSRSTLRFYNLHHRSTGVQNWEFYFLDPPGGLDSSGKDKGHGSKIKSLAGARIESPRPSLVQPIHDIDGSTRLPRGSIVPRAQHLSVRAQSNSIKYLAVHTCLASADRALQKAPEKMCHTNRSKTDRHQLQASPACSRNQNTIASRFQLHPCFDTLTDRNPLFCKAPLTSIYGFILGPYRIVEATK